MKVQVLGKRFRIVFTISYKNAQFLRYMIGLYKTEPHWITGTVKINTFTINSSSQSYIVLFGGGVILK